MTKTEAASTYATKSEIPDVSNLITEAQADIKYASKESLVNLTTNEEFNTYKQEVDTNYAKKTELPDLTGLELPTVGVSSNVNLSCLVANISLVTKFAVWSTTKL